jgi:hypothetical protein
VIIHGVNWMVVIIYMICSVVLAALQSSLHFTFCMSCDVLRVWILSFDSDHITFCETASTGPWSGVAGASPRSHPSNKIVQETVFDDVLVIDPSFRSLLPFPFPP